MSKKKIGILTFHNACNYGAFLQTKALMDKLDEFQDVDAFIIDYRNRKVEQDYSLNGIFNSSRNLKIIFLKLLRLKDVCKRNRIFSEFQKETFQYISYSDKSEINKLYKVVVGSDQVWGRHITGNDDTYFLTFVDSKKRTSYAASAGRVDENFPTVEFKLLLNDFTYISVREKDLYLKLVEMGFQDRVTICLDPVFLKKKRQWEEYAGEEVIIKVPYILIFIMGVSKQADYIVNQAILLAKELNSEIILLGDQERWYKYRRVRHFGVATPREFLNLIRNAQCVLTNSFHATSFSIILHIPFYTEMNIKNSGRLSTLLEITNLESRMMYDGKILCEYTENIDWNNVDKNLSSEIQHSCDYIEKHIIM